MIISKHINCPKGAFLVVQWYRVCFPMQGCRVAGDWKHSCLWRGDGIHQAWSAWTSECPITAKVDAGRETPGWSYLRHVAQPSAPRISAVRHMDVMSTGKQRRAWMCM